MTILAGGLGCAAGVAPPTGLERSGFQRPSTPEEIVGFLGELDRADDAAFAVAGSSAGGRPLGVTAIGRDLGRDGRTRGASPRLTVLLVGTQHGNEPAGGEALQVLARAAVANPRPDYLHGLDLVIVPDANPDGRASGRRGNARDVNLSTGFVVAAEPEIQLLVDALHRWRPDVVLDVHESAILKRESLARQGYLTDVEAQFERATNPNVDAGILALSDRILAAVIARVNAAGLPAQRYLGEITDVRQPIVRGGSSLNNLRNLAGMDGAMSFLLENRLDPRGQPFPTPRNIRGRLEKQMLTITAFLATCQEYRAEILATVAAARSAWRRGERTAVHLVADHERNPSQPAIVVPLRRIADGGLEQRSFERHDVIEGRRSLPMPLGYAITAHQDALAPILDRHRIAYALTARPVTISGTAQYVRTRAPAPAAAPAGHVVYDTDERPARLTLAPGALWIALDQPARRLIPLLLEPRSDSSIFQHPAYADLVRVPGDLFVYRVDAIGPPPMTAAR